MPTPLAVLPDLTIGDDPASYSFDLMLNGENVALTHPDTLIYAAITDIDITTIFCGPVQCAIVGGKWVANFTGTSTLNLLSDPTNLGSRLHKLLLKYADPTTDDITGRATGFGQAFLELQIGAPYQTRTERNLITVGKGLITSVSSGSSGTFDFSQSANSQYLALLSYGVIGK